MFDQITIDKTVVVFLKVAIPIFLMIVFTQSGLDKIIDRDGNLAWLKEHFNDTFLKNIIPYLLIILTILYIFLGCFLEGTSMMVLTASVVLPMVQTAGIDLIWFGIYTVIVVEMAQITPPVGFNLFVLQGMTGRDILKITKAAMPFFFLMMLGIVILVVFPEIVTAPVQFMIQR